MDVIKLSFYKRTSDSELIEMAFEEIGVLRSIIDCGNIEEYWNEAMLLNNMIIEIKKRKLSIDKRKLIEKVLIE